VGAIWLPGPVPPIFTQIQFSKNAGIKDIPTIKEKCDLTPEMHNAIFYIANEAK
jgi:hypothetical protein